MNASNKLDGGVVVLDAKVRDEAIAAAACLSVGAVVALRAAGGADLASGARAELLARAVAREEVSLDIELLAFEQEAGKPNRNFVRFRDGAMNAIGRSGRGVPFLRDHDQYSVLARGGTIVASETTKVADGHYQLRQRATLVEPAAVERALRGLMSSVSIGFRATGPVLCSACGTEVMSVCWHWPGDQVKLEAGSKAVAIEWIYTDAELVETSEVSVPAVPTAGVERIKAALAAQGITGVRAVAAHERQTPQESNMDKLKSALVGLLALAATASDDEVVNAVTTIKRDREALAAANVELTKLQARHAAALAAADAASDARELAEFLAAGVSAGKFAPGSALEKSLGDFFAADKDGARKLADSLPRLTPVGEPPQRGGLPPASKPTGALSGAADRIAAHSPHASIDGVRATLAAMGKSPAEVDRIIASQLAPKEA